MTRVHPLYIVVEDVLSETVMSRLLAHVEYTGNMVCRIARGNGQIKSNLAKYKQASRVIPHIILTDLDRFPCPPALLDHWNVGTLPSTMLLRIAVREVEAWLLSDRKNIAAFLHTAVTRIPLSPEIEADPKRVLFNAINKTRLRRLIEEMVPSSGAHIGPMYNAHMCDFVRNHWQIPEACENAPSLVRTLTRLSAFLKD
jgi:hypothetical protein